MINIDSVYELYDMLTNLLDAIDDEDAVIVNITLKRLHDMYGLEFET